MGLRMPGTLEVTAQSPNDTRVPGALPDGLDLGQVLVAGDGALDQADVDTLGVLLGVDQGAVDQIRC